MKAYLILGTYPQPLADVCWFLHEKALIPNLKLPFLSSMPLLAIDLLNATFIITVSHSRFCSEESTAMGWCSRDLQPYQGPQQPERWSFRMLYYLLQIQFQCYLRDTTSWGYRDVPQDAGNRWITYDIIAPTARTQEPTNQGTKGELATHLRFLSSHLMTKLHLPPHGYNSSSAGLTVSVPKRKVISWEDSTRPPLIWKLKLQPSSFELLMTLTRQTKSEVTELAGTMNLDYRG